VGASALPILPARAFAQNTEVTAEALEQAADQPVLDLKGFKDPIIIEFIQLLKKGREYFVRVRSKDGAEGVSVDNGRIREFTKSCGQVRLRNPRISKLSVRGGELLEQRSGINSAFLFTAYANSFSTTSPCTSVSRKSRPWKRYVNFV